MTTTTAPAPPVPERRWWTTAAIAAGVIALCYGFARYAYGLFAPRFSETFQLSPAGIGVLGGLSTAGYGLGLLAAPRASARSARGTVLAAGTLAAGGLALMGAAPNVVAFGAGLVIAGSSAGLVSPGVAQLINETVEPGARPRAQTWANTGTSLGLAASAFTPLVAFSWNLVWIGFASLAATMTLVALRGLPRAAGAAAPVRTAAPPPRLLMPLLVNSVLLGLTSAPYWTFAGSRFIEAGLSPTGAGWCWFAIGACGVLGGGAGRATERLGLRTTNLIGWTFWAAGIALLALPAPGLIGSAASAGLFGAAYMALTGLCILWASRLFPHRLSHGVTLAFLGLGVGQTAGSPLAGALAEHFGLGAVFALAAALSLTAFVQLTTTFAPPSATRLRRAERSPS